jgi:hypothetical protein
MCQYSKKELIMKKLYLFLLVFLFSTYCELKSEEIIITQNNDTLIVINKGIWANCAAKFEADLALCEDHISIIERDTSIAKAFCDCTYDFETKIDSLPNGFYTLNIYREQLKQYNYPSDTVLFIGTATILIDKYSGSYPVEYFTYQSDCYNATGIYNELNIIKFNQPEVYPNPAKDLINVKFYSFEAGNADIGIYSASGVKIVNFLVKNINAGYNERKLILKEIIPGIYIIKITVNGQFNNSQKLTILK